MICSQAERGGQVKPLPEAVVVGVEERMPDDPSNRSGGSLTAATNAGHGAASGSDQFVLIRIEGMHCHRCEQAIKKLLQRKPGVHEAEVDFASGQASILF